MNKLTEPKYKLGTKVYIEEDCRCQSGYIVGIYLGDSYGSQVKPERFKKYMYEVKVYDSEPSTNICETEIHLTKDKFLLKEKKRITKEIKKQQQLLDAVNLALEPDIKS